MPTCLTTTSYYTTYKKATLPSLPRCKMEQSEQISVNTVSNANVNICATIFETPLSDVGHEGASPRTQGSVCQQVLYPSPSALLQQLSSGIPNWVLDSESGFFRMFMILKQNQSFVYRYMSNKSWDVFSGEKKRLRQDCWEHDTFKKDLESDGMIAKQLKIDTG